MTIREFFVETLGEEKRAFLAVLDAIKDLPREKLDYKPDPKSKSGFELAGVIAREMGMIKKFLDTGVWDMKEEMSIHFDSVALARAELETNIDAALAKAASMTEADWDSMGMAWAPMTKGDFAIMMLLDLIHHRGQLSTYIRAMGGKNPSIYGPSADVSMEELMKMN
jgi:uncharacterized damage-inducible protein DinB